MSTVIDNEVEELPGGGGAEHRRIVLLLEYARLVVDGDAVPGGRETLLKIVTCIICTQRPLCGNVLAPHRSGTAQEFHSSYHVFKQLASF